MDRFRFDLTQLTTPAAEPLSLAEAKSHLYEDEDHNDAEITAAITEARLWLEEQTDVRLITQRWRITCDAFPTQSKWLYIPLWPLVSVQAVAYVDLQGQTQSLDLATLAIRQNALGRSRIARKEWAAWPTVQKTPDAVTIDINLGFGDGSNNVPQTFVRPIKLLLAHFYEHRGDEDSPMPQVLRDLVAGLRPPDELTNFALT